VSVCLQTLSSALIDFSLANLFAEIAYGEVQPLVTVSSDRSARRLSEGMVVFSHLQAVVRTERPPSPMESGNHCGPDATTKRPWI
jgi:hypothetical protein